MDSQVELLLTSGLSIIEYCIALLRTSTDEIDTVITRVESLISAISLLSTEVELSWSPIVLQVLQNAVVHLENYTEQRNLLGNGRIHIRVASIEYFLSHNFKVPNIAKLLGVSTRTIFRRMSEEGLTVGATYSEISDHDLESTLATILANQPNTGYKRMKGHLLSRSIKVTEIRIREAMRRVDPAGVYQRTLQRNHVIRRREYYVKYSNQIWHIDGNLKLIRWGFVIRGGIDGKSRTITYLGVSSDNTAETHLEQFLGGVRTYGAPIRTRSDKGGENVMIAKYMIDVRGTGRSSHICGRSVHNQRIERLWRDVSYGCTIVYYNIFYALEDDLWLDLDNMKHLVLLHKIFLPRLSNSLREFMDGWNNHPLSTENYKTPRQLMILHLPPPDYDLAEPAQEHSNEFAINDILDLDRLNNGLDITTPTPPEDCLTVDEKTRLAYVNFERQSDSFGYDIFVDAVKCLDI